MDELAHWLIDADRHGGVAMTPKAGAHGELCGLLCIRAAHDAAGRSARASCWCPKARTAPIRRRRPFAGFSVENIPQRRRARRSGRAEGAAWSGCRRRDDHQSQHLRPVRARHEGDFRCGPCGGRLCLLRRRQFQRHRSARCGRATLASMRCTSTCTRPFPPRMAAAGREPGRWCCRRHLSPFGPLPLYRAMPMGRSVWSRKRPAANAKAQFRTDDGVPWPDGHVHPRAGLHPEPRRRRLRQVAEDAVLNANYVLRSLEDDSTRRSRLAGRACTRRCSATMVWPMVSPRSTSPRA
jgi:glycine dehydrogenase subunit 2